MNTHMMTVILLMENKGGVGKSLMAELVSSALVGAEKIVARADTDSANASFTTIYPDARFVDLSESNVKAGGELAAVILDSADAGAEYLIIDTGARDEARIKGLLDQVLGMVKDVAKFVVFRPVNLNLQVHQNALDFTEKFAGDGRVSVVFALSVACGRKLVDFGDVWYPLQLREKVLQLNNVREIIVEDMGPVFAENLSMARLPLRAIVEGDLSTQPDMAPEIFARLAKIYDRSTRLSIGQWLKTHEARVLDALAHLSGAARVVKPQKVV